jgi:catechol 2,3-dioxygenase-like lactoylglutathione lyase family enzyme
VIDHVYISVTNIERSLAFYLSTLKPLGWRESGNYDAANCPDTVPDLYGLGDPTYITGAGVGSSIWLRQRQPGETACTSALCARRTTPLTPRMPPRSRLAVRTRARQPTGPTSRPATTPPMSPTSMATDWN